MGTKPSGRWRSVATGLAVSGLAGLLAKDLNLNALVSYWGSVTPWVLGFTMLGAVFWISRVRLVLVAFTVFLALLWLCVAFTPLTAWLARDLPRRDGLLPADAVFVLGSNIQEDGELTSEAMSRLLHALELLGQGLAPRLIVSELPAPAGSYAQAARNLMRNLALQNEVLAVGPVGRTRDEAVAVAALMRSRGWGRLLVVTSPPHSPRASATLEAEGIEVISSPATETRFNLENLERVDDRILAFGDVVHEKLGWWVYAERGWLGPPRDP